MNQLINLIILLNFNKKNFAKFNFMLRLNMGDKNISMNKHVKNVARLITLGPPPTSIISYYYLNNCNIELYFEPQQDRLFIKRKYGLFKNFSVENKIIKTQLIQLSNIFKKKTFISNNLELNKRPKIIFYKKLNKLFFRSGRGLLLGNFKIKKKLTQKFISKRIVSVLKNDWTRRLDPNCLSNVILHTNLFYTHNDTTNFITNTGILINKKTIYNPTYKIEQNLLFSFCFYRFILNFFYKKRQKIIFNIKNIKFYKFRSKLFYLNLKSTWLPSSDWIKEHFILYLYKNSNIEFDLRILTGVILYNCNFRQFSSLFYNANTSLFMSRSYNWKYII